MIKENETVLVTGATGYIAQHVIYCLQKKEYKVRGTVRSLKNHVKVNALRNIYVKARYPLELTEANLLEDEGWDAAVRGCKYVIHVASPLPNNIPKNEDDVVKPAVEGTRRVLEACARAGSVKRVVLTSSIRAVHGEWTVDNNRVYNEENWTDLDSNCITPYDKSKTLAEKLAWNFLNGLPQKDRFEMAVVNPGIVLGPILTRSCRTSVQIIYRMMNWTTMMMIPRINLSVCDVRDVAEAHVKAMVIPETNGHRHIIASGNIWLSDIGKILSEEFLPKGYSIPQRAASYFLLWLFSFFDKSSVLFLNIFGKVFRFDNTRMTEVLGINAKDIRDTVLDTAYSLIQHGIIPNKSRG